MKFKSDSSGGELNGFVDRGSHLAGELKFETSFRVEGRVDGIVTSHGSLIIGEAGEVEGEIRAGEVFVAGTVRGTIQAERKVQIAPTGKVYAEILTPALVIENGAQFEGRCTMQVGSGDGAEVTRIADRNR